MAEVRVIHSLMPQGVEHRECFTCNAANNLVIHSLMPQGVEHNLLDRIVSAISPVIHSLMPQGVEHIPQSGLMREVYE